MAEHCVLHHPPTSPKQSLCADSWGLDWQHCPQGDPLVKSVRGGGAADVSAGLHSDTDVWLWPRSLSELVYLCTEQYLFFHPPGPLWALALLRNSAAPQSQMLQVELQPRAAVLTAIILSALTVSVSEIGLMTPRPCENRMRGQTLAFRAETPLKRSQKSKLTTQNYTSITLELGTRWLIKAETSV